MKFNLSRHSLLFGVVLTFVGFVTACNDQQTGHDISLEEVSADNLGDKFIHHVYFWMNEPGNAAHVDSLIEGLNALAKVKTIKSYHIGTPAQTPRDVVDNSYGVSWLAVFDNAADQDAYQIDPIHLKFVDDYSHLWQRVQVYDTKALR